MGLGSTGEFKYPLTSLKVRLKDVYLTCIYKNGSLNCMRRIRVRVIRTTECVKLLSSVKIHYSITVQGLCYIF